MEGREWRKENRKAIVLGAPSCGAGGKGGDDLNSQGNLDLQLAPEYLPCMSLRRDPELGLRQLVAAILLQAVKDYFFALRHDLISRDSWLAAAPKLSEYGSGVTKSGMMKVNNGRGNQDMKAGGVEGVREVLEFFGGRRLESACLHAEIRRAHV